MLLSAPQFEKMAFRYVVRLSFLGMLPVVIQSRSNCPLLGADFPAPRDLSSQPSMKSSIASLSQVLKNTISTTNSIYGSFDSANTSFALEIFSTHEVAPLFTKYYTSPSVAENTFGSQSVDTNTIFRIGSLTKLLTIYTFLINDGDIKFNDPVTKYVPELAAAASSLNAAEDSLEYVDWEDITLGELASQSAGIGRDYAGVGEVSGIFFNNPNTAGLPPLNSSDASICAGGAFCSRSDFFKGFTTRHPVYASSHGAIYSNAAYLILAYALEDITGSPMQELVEKTLYAPLNMTDSSWIDPLSISNTTALIQDYETFFLSAGDETAAGGSYSTPSDVTSLGRSILTSSLLKSALTRRWLKPHSLLSSPLGAVGAPWEIHRLQLSPNSRLVDLYTKAGDFAGYASHLVLIPDWDVGFTVLAAGPNATPNVAVLAAIVADEFLPAIENAAREEAEAAFSGSYASVDASLNSSMTLSTSLSKPGLGITSWISNGTNLLDASSSIIAAPEFRLYPSGLSRELNDGSSVVGWRVVGEDLTGEADPGPFGLACDTWEMMDSKYWGEVASDEVWIRIDRNGTAVSVEPKALRVILEKIGDEIHMS